jgi:hypothetical protein
MKGNKQQAAGNSAAQKGPGGKDTALSSPTDNLIANQVFRLALFDHLPRKQLPKDPDSIEGDRNLHISTIQLGLMFHKGVIQCDDDRVHALIAAFHGMISDYKTPPKKILREDLDRYISKQVSIIVCDLNCVVFISCIIIS